MKSQMQLQFYITRDTDADRIEIWDADYGIRKFRGCIEYGSGDEANYATSQNDNGNRCMCMSFDDCRNTFGFVPKPGEAWFIDGNKQTIERVDEDMVFS